MLETTLRRLDGLIPKERRIIVTHNDQLQSTKAVAANHCAHILGEPSAKNTAPALAYAALYIKHLHKGSTKPVMISLHADHVIQKHDKFVECLHKAVAVAETGLLALLGIVPTYPETGYGYIQKGQPLSKAGGFQVESFLEKPDLETAKSYISRKTFFWNAGIFVWQVPSLLGELEQRLPIIAHTLEPLIKERSHSKEDWNDAYKKLPKISIDNAVLETSNNVGLVEADIGWQDVGSWNALSQCFKTDAQNNILWGDIYSEDCRSTTVDSSGQFVACIGLENIIVVTTKDAVLVCDQKRAQDVKDIVEHLKAAGRTDLV